MANGTDKSPRISKRQKEAASSRWLISWTMACSVWSSRRAMSSSKTSSPKIMNPYRQNRASWTSIPCQWTIKCFWGLVIINKTRCWNACWEQLMAPFIFMIHRLLNLPEFKSIIVTTMIHRTTRALDLRSLPGTSHCLAKNQPSSQLLSTTEASTYLIKIKFLIQPTTTPSQKSR